MDSLIWLQGPKLQFHIFLDSCWMGRWDGQVESVIAIVEQPYRLTATSPPRQPGILVCEFEFFFAFAALYRNWAFFSTRNVDRNNIGGPLPISWQNYTALRSFTANRNKLNGTLPIEWANGLPKLSSLLSQLMMWTCTQSSAVHSNLLRRSLGFNEISGVLPDALPASLTSLWDIANSFNPIWHDILCFFACLINSCVGNCTEALQETSCMGAYHHRGARRIPISEICTFGGFSLLLHRMSTATRFQMCFFYVPDIWGRILSQVVFPTAGSRCLQCTTCVSRWFLSSVNVLGCWNRCWLLTFPAQISWWQQIERETAELVVQPQQCLQLVSTDRMNWVRTSFWL